MSEIVVRFIGSAERTSRENVLDFIDSAKRRRFFLGNKRLRWDDSSWDFRPFFAKVGQSQPGMTAHFTNLETTRRGNRAADAVDFSQPYLDFARALLVEFLSTTSETNPSAVVTSLRLIERSFRELEMEPDICTLSNEVLDGAINLARKLYKDPWKLGRLLERFISEYINPGRLIPDQLDWKNPIKYQKPARNDAVNRDGGATGNTSKLPHLKSILDLSGVFHSSREPHDVVVTSWFALAMFAPERVNEILALPVDCQTEMDGTYGLSWRPLKGGQPKTNFAVSDEWGPLAREAIERLVLLGEKSRKAAKWYERNPRKLFLPPGMGHLRDKPVTLAEASAILGRGKQLVQGSRPRNALEFVGTCRDQERGAPAKPGGFVRLFAFSSLENYVLQNLPSDWPYIDRRHRLKASEGLFCLPSEILRSYADTEWYFPSFITETQIMHELGAKPTGETIFARHNLLNPSDGQPWRLQTHQPRHLLNTLAQSKHVSQQLIAFWSGRKSVRQNEYYNHMPQEFYLEEWMLFDERASRTVEVLGPLHDKIEERSRKEAISRDDALRLELGPTIATRFGLCRHDYALTGCPKDKDCIRCGDNTFIKGNDDHLREAQSQLAIHTAALANVEAVIAKGEVFGAEEWRKRHAEKAERWRIVVDLLTDPDVPDGTLITLPPVSNPQSKNGLAIELRNLNAKSELQTSDAEGNPASALSVELWHEDDL